MVCGLGEEIPRHVFTSLGTKAIQCSCSPGKFGVTDNSDTFVFFLPYHVKYFHRLYFPSGETTYLLCWENGLGRGGLQLLAWLVGVRAVALGNRREKRLPA